MRFKYDRETKVRAVRMFEERRQEAPEESRLQSTSLAFIEKLLDLGLTPSVGRVGTG